MKKLLAGLFALVLVLAACSNDESSKNADKEKQAETKTEQTKQKTSSDKVTTAKNDNKKENTQQDKTGNNTDNAAQKDTTQQHHTSAQVTHNTAQQNNTQPDQQTAGTNSTEPYQGQNVVPVAQNLVRQPISAQQAQQVLPDFQVALERANAEVNQFNGYQNPYNDYAIEGEDGYNMYVFSFLNQANPGTYTIVTVDATGQSKIVDPAYRQ
ncbi:hypothetical protein [Staphylococcus americanisciuri]|uniref:Lipoprotein n=1 Tax=Staphylococcus americanisciuri TaxID=2973940 RepID=A0ABT2F158_9STAP|nr:hypothetical protein [Staphylococcus americanisciuri]MCS4486104.1 hypothetical protein [Staphylococcus americanisciuri]